MSKTWPYWVEEDKEGLKLIFNGFLIFRIPRTYTPGGGLTSDYKFTKYHLEELVAAADKINGLHVEIEKVQDKEIVATMPHHLAFGQETSTIGRAIDIVGALKDLAEKLGDFNIKATDGEAGYG